MSCGVAYAIRLPSEIRATASQYSASVTYLGGDDDRHACLAQAVELLPHLRPQEGVNACRRLVEDEQGGRVDHCAGKLETALHAAGQGRCAAVSRLREVDQFEHFGDAPPPAPGRHPVQRGDELDVLACRQIRVQHEQLGHVANALASPATKVARILAQHPDGACVRGERSGDESDGRRLARSARPDDPDDPSLRHTE